AAAGGTYHGTGTMQAAIVCEGDADEDGLDALCGDNCPDDFNPFQEDCDDDGIGDACDTETDGDEDCVCDGDDNCPFTPNPGQEDTDGDFVGDACDPCPNSNPDDADNDGVCDDVDTCPGHDDNADADGDGVPDGCDQCPGSDDGAAGALDDDDGDGVINCNAQCNGVDDAVFAPECDNRIPTVSVWGLVVLALLLLAAGKIHFSRRGSPA
ncbi:MAG: thrombospondin type 3 repeat-containing protein, partial [Planctomycetes bacterium]|nr:thrombospondin type 3 repeat-containing protein [Planctomycetota bacterium]